MVLIDSADNVGILISDVKIGNFAFLRKNKMAIIDTSKIIFDLAKRGMTVELQEKIMQLREEALGLQEENLNLKTENIELKKKQELQEKVTFKRKVYYREGDEVPYCPYCYEKQQLLIHLSFKGESESGQLHYCKGCNSSYTTTGQEDFKLFWISGRKGR